MYSIAKFNNNCFPKICFIFFLSGVVFFISSDYHKLGKTVNKLPTNRTSNWKTNFDNQGSESCVVPYDIDEDSRQDILIGTSSGGLFDDDIFTVDKAKKICKEKNLPFPCGGKIIAVRGYDGKMLWSFPTYMGVFVINCGNIDVNDDGKNDCIGSGRMGTVVAFDPRKGILLWNGQNSGVIKDSWNVYNPLILPDLNGDGVNDVLIANGGDQVIPAKITKRSAGRLIILNGKTGKSLGTRKHFLNIPGNKETYMSPVLHSKKDGAQHVLFGSGGETVAGSLFAISISNLYDCLIGGKLKTNGSFILWAKHTKFPNGIIEILSFSKGVMVPPLCVDMNMDGTDDILIMSFDGSIALIDGETLRVIWRREFQGMESYSSPAPGFFNNDASLDFMFHLCYGKWPRYDYTMTVILDGKTGSLLWSLKSSMAEITSALVLRTKQDNRDAFIFRTKGRNNKNNNRRLSHGLFVQAGEMAYQNVTNKVGDCQLSSLLPTTEIFIIDRSTVNRPILLHEMTDKSYNYSVTIKERQLADYRNKQYGKLMEELDKRFFKQRTVNKRSVPTILCTLLDLYESNTGAIGDFDGDGRYDLILLNQYVGDLHDDRKISFGRHYEIELVKINLEEILENKTHVSINATIRKTFDKENISLENVEFRQLQEQGWLNYLGKHFYSHYH